LEAEAHGQAISGTGIPSCTLEFFRNFFFVSVELNLDFFPGRCGNSGDIFPGAFACIPEFFRSFPGNTGDKFPGVFFYRRAFFRGCSGNIPGSARLFFPGFFGIPAFLLPFFFRRTPGNTLGVFRDFFSDT
jgi:hypothetical protein